MNKRREFLKRFAFLGATATLPVHNLFAQDITLPKPMNDGLFAVTYDEFVRPKTPRKITIPDVGEYKVLKGDFHIHTLFSDGCAMPRDRVLEAVDNGLDAISLTDHIEYRPNLGSNNLKLSDKNDDHNIAYNFAKYEADKNNLILVRGTEITKSALHFNAIFVKDVNPMVAVIDDWRAMIAVAVEQGGFIFWNHPNWINRDANTTVGLKSGDPMRYFDEIEELRVKGHLHGIEIFNWSSFYPIALDWCNEKDLAPLTSSDVHTSEWNLYGHQHMLRPITLVFAKERSHDSLREAFFAKRIVGWVANMVLGREALVAELFKSCVEIVGTGNRLTFRNRSDIPCVFEVEGKTSELLPQGLVEITFGAARKKLTVRNWFIGMNKPLEVFV